MVCNGFHQQTYRTTINIPTAVTGRQYNISGLSTKGLKTAGQNIKQRAKFFSNCLRWLPLVKI